MRRRVVGATATAARCTGAAVIAAGALVGCGASPTVDPHGVEANLVSSMERDEPGVDVTAACPPGVRLRLGASFTCTVTLDGTPTRYTVQVTDVSGSRYGIQSRPTEPVVDTAVVVASIKGKLGTAAAVATVSCGHRRFVQLALHKTFTCSVAAGGQTASVTATVTDEQGDVSFAGQPTVPAPTTTAGPAATLPVS